MNLYFCYLYRDAGNNKLRGEVLLSNEQNDEFADLQSKVSEVLAEDGYFDPDLAGIPRLDFDSYDPELDHSWHEYEELLPAPEQFACEPLQDIVTLIASLREAPSLGV